MAQRAFAGSMRRLDRMVSSGVPAATAPGVSNGHVEYTYTSYIPLYVAVRVYLYDTSNTPVLVEKT